MVSPAHQRCALSPILNAGVLLSRFRGRGRSLLLSQRRHERECSDGPSRILPFSPRRPCAAVRSSRIRCATKRTAFPHGGSRRHQLDTVALKGGSVFLCRQMLGHGFVLRSSALVFACSENALISCRMLRTVVIDVLALPADGRFSIVISKLQIDEPTL